MSFAIISAISLMCVDAAMAARPIEYAPVAVTEDAAPPERRQIAFLQDGAGANENESGDDAAVSAPPVEEIGSAPVTGAPAPGDAFDGPLVFEGEDDDAVTARLINYIEGIDSLAGDFTQISPTGVISTGRFYLRRPGLLRFEYEPPTPLLIVANGGIVYVRDEALETTDSYPVGRTPLKFLLRKNLELDDVEIRAVDRGEDTLAVTFGSDDDETEGEITIITSAPEFSLERWIVRDLQNGITVVALENVESGGRLANRLFEVPEAGGRFLKN